MTDDQVDMTYTYDPGVYEVDGIYQAKTIILTPDENHTTNERWEMETDYLIDLLKRYLPEGVESCVDYGCGIGRLAKRLIEQSNIRVFGADISAAMRDLAPGYVGSSRFLIGPPELLDRLVDWGLRFDVALAVWTLQHCQNPREHISLIKRSLRPGGRLFVLNAIGRFLPVIDKVRQRCWLNDGVDVWAMLNDAFAVIDVQPMDESIVPAPPSRWGVFECRNYY